MENNNISELCDYECLLNKFDLSNLIEFILSHNEYKSISLHFDENIIKISILLTEYLKAKLTDRFFFIIGDSSYSLCCADDIAAMHLKADLIIRVGNSCFTKNKQLPVYYLYELEEDNGKSDKILQSILNFNNISGLKYIIYNHKYTKIFEKIKSSLSGYDNDIRISEIPYRPDMYENVNNECDYIMHNRIFKNALPISKNSNILYAGDADDKILSELSLRHGYENKIYLLQEDFSITEFSSKSFNSIFYKRFNLIQKAKESDTFGIIVGNLSINNLTAVLDEVKRILKMSDKKFYTFLLGKITLEKLSNFVEYIDCFILISCPYSDFYNFKTLMKPLVSSLDIEIAFNEKYFKWDDMVYTFDTNYILKYNMKGNNSDNTKDNDDEKDNPEQELNYNLSNKLLLKNDDKNEILANIFSIKTIENYDKKRFKGIEINESKKEIEIFKLGKTGIPIKYEDIINK